MKTFLLFLLLLFAGYGRAQNIVDAVAYRFVYDAQLRITKKSNEMSNDEHYLDIGKNNISRYYSMWKAMRREVIDSVYAVGGKSSDVDRELQSKGIESSFFSYDILKNYPQRNEQTITYTTGQRLQYSEPSGMEWTLEDGDSTLLGYSCQKASTVYHGKKWTVWYTRDIAIPEGPWKLCGLPGLILNAKESNGDFIFNCIGVEKPVGKYLTLLTKKVIKTTPQKAHQTIEFIENDPLGYLNMRGKNVSVLVDGNSSNSIEIKRVHIESYR